MRNGVLRHQRRADHIHSQYAPPLLRRSIFHPKSGEVSGVVHNDIDAAKFGDCQFTDRARLGFILDIGRDRHRPAAQFRDPVGHRLRPGRIQVG